MSWIVSSSPQALQIIACTWNGTGIAMGSEILINYGDDFDVSCWFDTETRPVKRTRVAWDAMLDNGLETASDVLATPKRRAAALQRPAPVDKPQEDKDNQDCGCPDPGTCRAYAGSWLPIPNCCLLTLLSYWSTCAAVSSIPCTPCLAECDGHGSLIWTCFGKAWTDSYARKWMGHHIWNALLRNLHGLC